MLPWALSACAGAARPHLPSGPVDVVELHRANLCGTQGSAAQLSLLHDVNELQAWQAAHNVDFFNGRAGAIVGGAYAVVELGQRNTGGYSLLVSRRAKLHDGRLTLTASLLTPPSTQMTAQMVTSPCVLVALPPVELHELLLLDPSGEVLANWPPPPMPAAPIAPAAVPVAPAPVSDAGPVPPPDAAPVPEATPSPDAPQAPAAAGP